MATEIVKNHTSGLSVERQVKLVENLSLMVSRYYAAFLRVDPTKISKNSVNTPIDRLSVYVSQLGQIAPHALGDFVVFLRPAYLERYYENTITREESESGKIAVAWFDRFAQRFYGDNLRDFEITELSRLQKRMGMILHCAAYNPKGLRHVLEDKGALLVDQDPLTQLREVFWQTPMVSSISTNLTNQWMRTNYGGEYVELIDELLNPVETPHFEGNRLEHFGITDAIAQARFMSNVVEANVLFVPGSIQVDPEFRR